MWNDDYGRVGVSDAIMLFPGARAPKAGSLNDSRVGTKSYRCPRVKIFAADAIVQQKTGQQKKYLI